MRHAFNMKYVACALLAGLCLTVGSSSAQTSVEAKAKRLLGDESSPADKPLPFPEKGR